MHYINHYTGVDQHLVNWMTVDITLEVQGLQMLVILLLGLLKNNWPWPKVELSHWQLLAVWCIEF
jgi:hypothetical protein